MGQCDIAKVAQQLLDSHRAQLAGKPLELVLEGEEGVVIDAPESALAVALGNLIGNAVKYTQSGAVVVRVHAHSVDVIDSGPGLSAEDAAKLFEAAKAEELAVVESLHTRKVIGLLTEQYLLRRYAEELDKARRDITGEG